MAKKPTQQQENPKNGCARRTEKVARNLQATDDGRRNSFPAEEGVCKREELKKHKGNGALNRTTLSRSNTDMEIKKMHHNKRRRLKAPTPFHEKVGNVKSVIKRL